jgi:hypothetical protein
LRTSLDSGIGNHCAELLSASNTSASKKVATQTQAKKARAQSTKASTPMVSKAFALALFVDDAGDEDGPWAVLSVPVVVAVVADPPVPIIHQV